MDQMVAVTRLDGPGILVRPNKVGRPRAFQDEDVYRVMMDVIAEVGYARLTFALVSVQIKCTTSALIRRFGDKKSLVRGFIAWITEQQNALFRMYDDQGLSPLEVLRARLYLPTNSKVDTDNFTAASAKNFLAFFIEARSEPAYRPELARLSREFEDHAADTIRAAVEAGDLRPCNAPELAHLILVSLIGAQSLWLDHQRGSMLDEMERVWSYVIVPYLA
jgi:AcrR family transcriptional regulator